MFVLFFHFLGLHPRHMEVAQARVKLEYSCQPTPQPQQHQIWAVSETYTTAYDNTGSLMHWARPGIKLTSSWILGFHWATIGTPDQYCLYGQGVIIFSMKIKSSPFSKVLGFPYIPWSGKDWAEALSKRSPGSKTWDTLSF